MRYLHRFTVNASLPRVAAFHSRSANMAAITPAPVSVRMIQAPATMSDGSVIEFTLWMGPLPVNWVSRIEDLSVNGFLDRQLAGPYKSWLHRHRFIALGENQTLVEDEIHAELQSHPWWALVGLAMWLGMPLLFAFRARQTRRLLQDREATAA